MTDHHCFIYRDSYGHISHRVLANVSSTEAHLQGDCETRGRFRTFRKDGILEELSGAESLEFVEARLAHYRSLSPPSRPRSQPRVAPGTVEVCFTGFKAAEKKELIERATTAGFCVRPSITKKLHFLCCGENAGPAKVRKAREQGALALNAAEFLELADSGVIPDRD